MKNIIELTENNFESEVIQTPVSVVVDFCTPWCGPCKVLTPLLEQLAAGLSGRLKFAKANMDKVPGLVDCFEIIGVPTLLRFRNGEILDRLVGFPGMSQLKAWMDRAANTTGTASLSNKP